MVLPKIGCVTKSHMNTWSEYFLHWFGADYSAIVEVKITAESQKMP